MTNHIDFFSTVIQPVFEAYQSNKTKRTLNTRIYRGRAPSVSPIYENSVAEFIDQFFQDFKNFC